MRKSSTRRQFLCTAPLAAAALPLTSRLAAAQSGTTGASKQQPYQLITADTIAAKKSKVGAKPGNETLFENAALPMTVVLTTEEKKAAKEFEWHEGRDHIFQIISGTTTYELGGTPQNGRNTKPGEWLAPASAGATSITVHAGDMLVIPRGLPHKRTTEASVTFVLISTTGSGPA